jgi:hypothetical protein
MRKQSRIPRLLSRGCDLSAFHPINPASYERKQMGQAEQSFQKFISKKDKYLTPNRAAITRRIPTLPCCLSLLPIFPFLSPSFLGNNDGVEG